MGKVFLLLFLTVFSMGCIRLQGKAGDWYQGANDGLPKGKEIGFDTQDIVQRDRHEGGITR